jgi:hypothetical protein
VRLINRAVSSHLFRGFKIVNRYFWKFLDNINLIKNVLINNGKQAGIVDIDEIEDFDDNNNALTGVSMYQMYWQSVNENSTTFEQYL